MELYKTEQDIQTPDVLKDQCRFVRLLGEGANGKTYLAELAGTKQLVAVKVMKFTLADSFKSLELFNREAEVLKSVHVTGVPKVFDCRAGDASSMGYMIQEYIDAPSLQAVVEKNGKLGEDITLRILLKLAKIIGALHENYVPPVIHRDIKPSNVLCNLNVKDPVVTLIDFGAVANPQTRSAGSTVAGTFGYMAPEQMLGNVVTQSDYYSLGALALYLLTGIEPYKLETQGNAFEIDVADALRTHAPEVSENMALLIGHLMEPVADRRPANAFELTEEIRRVLNHQNPLNLSNTKPRWLRVLERIFSFLTARPKHVTISKRRWSKWPTVAGVVQVDHGDWVEYTFEVDGRTWLGLNYTSSGENKTDEETDHSRLNNVALSMDEGGFVKNTPRPCIVAYNPKDPRFSYLKPE